MPEKEYDDLTSTLEEQQEFEKGCLERLDILTKSPIMNEVIKEAYGPTDRNTKDQIASIMLKHGTPKQQKEALEYISNPTPRIINIENGFWETIKQAASESNWIPKEYYMNDWVSDICNFLRTGEGVNK